MGAHLPERHHHVPRLERAGGRLGEKGGVSIELSGETIVAPRFPTSRAT